MDRGRRRTGPALPGGPGPDGGAAGPLLPAAAGAALRPPERPGVAEGAGPGTLVIWLRRVRLVLGHAGWSR